MEEGAPDPAVILDAMEEDPEDVFPYMPLPDEDPVEKRALQYYLAMIFGCEEDVYPPGLLKWKGVFSENEVPTAELLYGEQIDEEMEFFHEEQIDEEQIDEEMEFFHEEQIDEEMEFSDEDNEDALVIEKLLIDDDSLAHEPLLRHRDEIWEDILEWPNSELNSISSGVNSSDGAFSFSKALQDRIHWNKLIYIQDEQPWDYPDLENAIGGYEFEDLEFVATEYSEALPNGDPPVPSPISCSEVLHHAADSPVPSPISPHPELQESGHPVDGDEDCLESSPSGCLDLDGSEHVLNQESEVSEIDDRAAEKGGDFNFQVFEGV